MSCRRSRLLGACLLQVIASSLFVLASIVPGPTTAFSLPLSALQPCIRHPPCASLLGRFHRGKGKQSSSSESSSGHRMSHHGSSSPSSVSSTGGIIGGIIGGLHKRRASRAGNPVLSSSTSPDISDPTIPSSSSSSSSQPIFVESYDGLRKHRVAWDHEKKRFSVVTHPSRWDGLMSRCSRSLRQSFLPDNVTPDYYNYTRWRILQRLISATVSVFGTRALLLALGLKTERVGLTATFNWIQKDAFGKFGRIMWASKMGRRFDSDAKRWRFRSSLLYAFGTGLEVLTYIFPAAFLLLATIANTLKQMSMLTSSATRNAMYKSFAGDSQNLGDITAKGEAQIAVVDLLGILLGISLSKMIGTAQVGMGVAYIALSIVDIIAIYNEIRSVVFNSLNLERGAMVVKAYVTGGTSAIPSPNEVSRRERIFLAPESIDPSIFRTVSQTGCSLEEVHRVREAFAHERFLITWSPSVGSSIVLHNKANESDMLRAMLTWAHFMDYMRLEDVLKTGKGEATAAASSSFDSEDHVLSFLKRAHTKAHDVEEAFLGALRTKGWDMRHTVFGKIKKRTDW